MIKEERLIDDATGEVVHQKAKQTKFSLFNEDLGYVLFLNNNNVRTFPHVPWPDGVTKIDKANLFELSRHIYGKTNMLAYRGNRNAVKPMSEQQMSEIVELCDKRFKTWLNRMIRFGLIAKLNIEIEDSVITQFYLNPLYFFSDKYLPLNLYLLFQPQLDRYLPWWARQRFADMQVNNHHLR